MKGKLLSTMFAVACATSMSYAQTREVSGVVTSSDGTPINGASISVVGANTATQSDASGRFKISVSSGASLNVSYIGYTAQRVSIGNSTNLSIVLASDNQTLEEVVVVGYAVSNKSVVGSFSRVSAKDIEGRPNANALEALQGKVPGLQVFTSTGEPSATQSVRLNGVGSINGGTTPLYVLDGIPVADGSIVSMNPNDFESVTVLKDASAT
ncbi:carboxypeptidase-like regulatory domain-containing protein [Sphingobacterium bovistauri]|uniref:TonB-dependent receptor plug domain-containing protein n=1 Tax=Sphingobacterium bovistauri TaxID=2781959 RepID=A0ABS7Z2G5_9SPHI|nr:carboxypeptidase-like regulatory domain-containing protein [Sphingobacterium bovistauri]MCA5004348.1 TonB-dependent receptor plug domain-containing protein [Sphingobacterium bovistauri]